VVIAQSDEVKSLRATMDVGLTSIYNLKGYLFHVAQGLHVDVEDKGERGTETRPNG
jgi:hypothetical protein